MGIIYDAIDLSYLGLKTNEKRRVDSRSNYNKVHNKERKANISHHHLPSSLTSHPEQHCILTLFNKAKKKGGISNRRRKRRKQTNNNNNSKLKTNPMHNGLKFQANKAIKYVCNVFPF